MVQHTGEMEELPQMEKKAQVVGGNETPPERVWFEQNTQGSNVKRTFYFYCVISY